MIAARSFANQTIGVFGLAETASVRALKAGGAAVFAWNDDEFARAAAGMEGASVVPFVEWPWTRIKTLVVGPGVAQSHPVMLAAQAAGAETIDALELFAREIRP